MENVIELLVTLTVVGFFLYRQYQAEKKAHVIVSVYLRRRQLGLFLVRHVIDP